MNCFAISGGVRFPDLTTEEADRFQENLIKVMIATETTFFDLAESSKTNCLVICDRGVMDATAYMAKQSWERIMKQNCWNAVELRDNRYNQVIHLITAANGAEPYYNIEDNPTRTEGLELARQLDKATIEAWVGHPYIDVIDNSTDFDTKLKRMIAVLIDLQRVHSINEYLICEEYLSSYWYRRGWPSGQFQP